MILLNCFRKCCHHNMAKTCVFTFAVLMAPGSELMLTLSLWRAVDACTCAHVRTAFPSSSLPPKPIDSRRLGQRMVLLRTVVHPRSLPARQQLRVAKLRVVDCLSWNQIAKRVWNLVGVRPTWKACSRAYAKLQSSRKPKADAYQNCGRPKKLGPKDEQWLVKKMLELRKKGPCTSVVLQRLLAKHRKVAVEASLVRRVLTRNGYR